jgi:hypothetical protein
VTTPWRSGVNSLPRYAALPPVAVGALVIAVCVVAVALLATVGWPASSYRHSDFTGFWSGGRAILEGRSPYEIGYWLELHARIGSRGSAIVPAGTAFGYPLPTALVFAPIALFPVAVAAPLWFVSQVALAGSALFALARSLFGAAWRRDLPVLFAIVASSQPAWVLAEGGNIGGFLLAIVAGGVALLLRGHAFLSGCALGLLVIKPHPFLLFAPALLLAAPARHRVPLAAGGLFSSATLVGLAFLLRPDWLAGWLTAARRIGGAPVGRANIWGIAESPWLGGLVLLLLIAVLLLWQRERRAPAVVAAAALPLSLLAAPYGWSYDQLVLAVSVAACLSLIGSMRAPLRAAALALVAAVLVPLPWLLYALAFKRGDESASLLTPLAVFATLLVLDRAAGRR